MRERHASGFRVVMKGVDAVPGMGLGRIVLLADPSIGAPDDSGCVSSGFSRQVGSVSGVGLWKGDFLTGGCTPGVASFT